MSISNWNQAFSNLIRETHAGSWGNWSLDSTIAVGAVGYLDPETGSFVPVTMLDNDRFRKVRLNEPQDWLIESSGVGRTETSVNFEGGYMDPTSGTEVNVGTEVTWNFGSKAGMASNASVIASEHMDKFGVVLQKNFDWLANIAQSVGFGDGKDISQGFGVITSTLICTGVVNVGSDEKDSSFSITGSVDGIADMTGSGTVTGKIGGSFKDTSSTKAVDSHIFPSKADTRAKDELAIAFNFASFDGNMILSSWVQKLNPFSITFDNAHGGTYIAEATVTYNYEQDGAIKNGRLTTSVSGGLSANVSGIPVNATNLHVLIHFVAASKSDNAHFTWRTPASNWLGDHQTIDIKGAWPDLPRASVRGR